MTPEEAGQVFVDPTAYAEKSRFHEAPAYLRSHDPVRWVEEPGYLPFRAVTRHADVTAVERDNHHLAFGIGPRRYDNIHRRTYPLLPGC